MLSEETNIMSKSHRHLRKLKCEYHSKIQLLYGKTPSNVNIIEVPMYVKEEK